MIREKVRFQEIISVVTDVLTIFISYVLAVYIRYEIMDSQPGLNTLSAPYLLIAMAYSIIIASILQYVRKSRERKPAGGEYGLFSINAIGCLFLLAFFYIIGELDFSRWALVIFWLISSFLLILKSILLTVIFDKKQLELTGKMRILLVGGGEVTRTYINSVCWDTACDFHILGYVGDKTGIFFDYDFEGTGKNAEARGKMTLQDIASAGWLGNYEDLENVLQKTMPDEVVFTLEDAELGRLSELLVIARKSNVKVSMVPSFGRYIPENAAIHKIDEIKVIDLCGGRKEAANDMHKLGLTLSVVFLMLMLIIKQFKIGNLESFRMYEDYRSFIFAMTGFFVYNSMRIDRVRKYGSTLKAALTVLISAVIIGGFEVVYSQGVELMQNIGQDLLMTVIVIGICWCVRIAADFISRDDISLFY